jgi:hypothetical protein
MPEEATIDAGAETADVGTTNATNAATETEGGEDTTDWKAEARKWEGRSKTNSDAAARLKEIEDAAKSETEKLTEDNSTLRTERDDAVLELARYKAAVKHGLDLEDIDLLGHGTEEDIDKRAARLASRTPVEPKGRTTNRTLGRTEEAKPTPDQWLREAARR